MQIHFTEIHDKYCCNDLGNEFISVIEFAKVIKKPGNDEQYQSSIKPSHVKKRDEQKSGERNCQGHGETSYKRFWLQVDLSPVGVIDQPYPGGEFSESGQEKYRDRKWQ